jgi:hypothetical protein
MKKNYWQKEMFENQKYWGKIIAIKDEKIFNFAESYDEIFEKVKDNSFVISFYHVPKQLDLYRIMTFAR